MVERIERVIIPRDQVLKWVFYGEKPPETVARLLASIQEEAEYSTVGNALYVRKKGSWVVVDGICNFVFAWMPLSDPCEAVKI